MLTKLFALALPLFIAGDMLWIGFIARDFYRTQIGSLMSTTVTWPAAILFYVLFVFGLTIFVIMPAVERGSWLHTLTYGAFFGLVTYATYDLTNLAIAKDWPLLVTVIDMVWGATVSALVSLGTYFLYAWFFI